MDIRPRSERKRTALARRIEVWPVERLLPYVARLDDDPEPVEGAFAPHAPILLSWNMGIVAGQRRLWRAMERGIAEVPVVVLDGLTPQERRAYLAADQKLRENPAWDERALDLKSLEEEASFTDEDIRALKWNDV